MSETKVIEADLCIVGAGYAGVNALNAAARYIPKGGRIVWVDRREQLGGMWVDQYDYVTLHQPHSMFTAGERRWKIKKHWSHLATKPEILEHFEDIAKTCTKERSIDLVRLFGYEMSTYSVHEDEKIVEVTSTPVKSESDLPVTVVKANRLIKATGFQVPIKKPIKFSAADKIQSLAPVNIMRDDWNEKIKASEAPIYVLGSGKTSIDVMNRLAKDLGVAERVHNISGHGTLFMNRDVIFPKPFFRRNFNFGKTFLDWMRTMVSMFDGTNSVEVVTELQKRGFLHSPIPGATGFMMGISSEDEVGTVRKALTPADKFVMRAHLVDIVEEDGKIFLKLRELDGKTYFQKEVPEGTFLVNCTDHFVPKQMEHEPILSEDGLVLSPQTISGFSGPSANYCTHLFYMERLEHVWKNLPRLEMDLTDKTKFGIELGMCVLVSTEALTRACKPIGREVSPPLLSVAKHLLVPAGIRFVKQYGELKAHIREVIKTRFTDESKEYVAPPVLGGNIGVSASDS